MPERKTMIGADDALDRINVGESILWSIAPAKDIPPDAKQGIYRISPTDENPATTPAFISMHPRYVVPEMRDVRRCVGQLGPFIIHDTGGIIWMKQTIESVNNSKPLVLWAYADPTNEELREKIDLLLSSTEIIVAMFDEERNLVFAVIIPFTSQERLVEHLDLIDETNNRIGDDFNFNETVRECKKLLG